MFSGKKEYPYEGSILDEPIDDGRAKLNWATGTYSRFDEIPPQFQDYHAQGIGSLTGGNG